MQKPPPMLHKLLATHKQKQNQKKLQHKPLPTKLPCITHIVVHELYVWVPTTQASSP